MFNQKPFLYSLECVEQHSILGFVAGVSNCSMSQVSLSMKLRQFFLSGMFLVQHISDTNTCTTRIHEVSNLKDIFFISHNSNTVPTQF